MASNYPAALDDASSLYTPADKTSAVSLATTLSANALSGDTTLQVASTAGFPATYGVVFVADEQIIYAAKTSTTFTGCVRGANNTTATGHSSGAAVRALHSSIFAKAIQAAVIAIQETLGIDGAYNFPELDGSTPADGEALVFDGGSGKYTHAEIAGGGGGAVDDVNGLTGEVDVVAVANQTTVNVVGQEIRIGTAQDIHIGATPQFESIVAAKNGAAVVQTLSAGAGSYQQFLRCEGTFATPSNISGSSTTIGGAQYWAHIGGTYVPLAQCLTYSDASGNASLAFSTNKAGVGLVDRWAIDPDGTFAPSAAPTAAYFRTDGRLRAAKYMFGTPGGSPPADVVMMGISVEEPASSGSYQREMVAASASQVKTFLGEIYTQAQVDALLATIWDSLTTLQGQVATLISQVASHDTAISTLNSDVSAVEADVADLISAYNSHVHTTDPDGDPVHTHGINTTSHPA